MKSLFWVAAGALAAAAPTPTPLDLRTPSRLVELPAPDRRAFGGARVAFGRSRWQAEIFRAIPPELWALHLKTHPEEQRPIWELEHWCGAALIAPDWVVTAAHCVLVNPDESAPLLRDDFERRRAAITVSQSRGVRLADCIAAEMVIPMFHVRMGVADISRPGGTTMPIDCAVVHPGWSPSDRYHDDIALLHLASATTSLVERGAVSTIDWQGGAALTPGTRVTASGWGKTADVPGFAPSAVLMEVGLDVEDTARCATALAEDPSHLRGGVFCAGAPARKTCLGDSGGPVSLATDGQSRLVGVVSWGKTDCAGDGRPGVYTRIATYAGWIADVLGAER